MRLGYSRTCLRNVASERSARRSFVSFSKNDDGSAALRLVMPCSRVWASNATSSPSSYPSSSTAIACTRASAGPPRRGMMWDTWQRTPESLATCTVSSTASTASTSLLRVWQAYIASYRAATPHRSTVSRWEAIRSHEDSRPVEYPNAPASSPSSSRLVICSISSGEAGRSSKPITAMRRLPLGTSEATLIAGRAESSASRYSENVRHVISVRGSYP